jgi:hypothetical protein
MFPLCWYPARERLLVAPGIVRLDGSPILLQAAIWRRDWFLALADSVNPRCSPWGFEAMATQAAKGMNRTIYAADIPAGCGSGPLIDGMDKSAWPLPYHNLMHDGRWNCRHVRFCRSHGVMVDCEPSKVQPMRGLGDAVAMVTTVIGIQPCVGCKERQAILNKLVPFGTKE